MKLIINTLILIIFISGCSAQPPAVSINTVTYEVDLAQTPQEHSQGLQNVEYMPEEKGMLFIFEEAKDQSFWMHKTLIPLDIIFINSDLEIINIETATPCTEEIAFNCRRYESQSPAKYVLELNAGQAKKNNISPQDKIKLKL